jgi:hypothetical protein
VLEEMEEMEDIFRASGRCIGRASDRAALKSRQLILDRNKNVGWAGIIRVDGVPYQWLGNPGYKNVNQTNFSYTSTKSIFKLEVEGKVSITVTFLSPVTPNDLMRQSLVFSYMDVEVYSQDGQLHDVQLYSDISAGKYVLLRPLPQTNTIRMGIWRP